MTGTRGLMMPAFSAAISGSVSPSHCWWSRATGVIMAAAGVTMLVASRRPPRPLLRWLPASDRESVWVLDLFQPSSSRERW